MILNTIYNGTIQLLRNKEDKRTNRKRRHKSLHTFPHVSVREGVINAIKIYSCRNHAEFVTKLDDDLSFTFKQVFSKMSTFNDLETHLQGRTYEALCVGWRLSNFQI